MKCSLSLSHRADDGEEDAEKALSTAKKCKTFRRQFPKNLADDETSSPTMCRQIGRRTENEINFVHNAVESRATTKATEKGLQICSAAAPKPLPKLINFHVAGIATKAATVATPAAPLSVNSA